MRARIGIIACLLIVALGGVFLHGVAGSQAGNSAVAALRATSTARPTTVPTHVVLNEGEGGGAPAATATSTPRPAPTATATRTITQAKYVVLIVLDGAQPSY